MLKSLDEVDFIIFDTETTGLDPIGGDRIVEIAAVKFKGRQRIDIFQSLINAGRPISEGAYQVNKITQDMLKDAPKIETVMPEFLNFIRGSCLCSYTVTFDLEFINGELRLMGKDILSQVDIVDILRMSKRLMPGLERYALWFVADRLGIMIKQEHRALSDVELTLAVFNRLMDLLKTKGINDFKNFLELFSISSSLLENINNQKIAKIQEAIDLGVKLKIKYLASSNAEVSSREIIPKEIKQERNVNYLTGFCFLRNEERTFRIDGILHLEII